MDPGGSNTWTTRHREHTGHHGFQLNGRTRPATLSHGRASNVKSAGLAKESTYGSRIHSEPWRAHANFGQRAKKLESEILQARHIHSMHMHIQKPKPNPVYACISPQCIALGAVSRPKHARASMHDPTSHVQRRFLNLAYEIEQTFLNSACKHRPKPVTRMGEGFSEFRVKAPKSSPEPRNKAPQPEIRHLKKKITHHPK